MKRTLQARPVLCLLAINTAILMLAGGCATPDEHPFNQDFGENLPAEPKYAIQDENENSFILKVHQGVPLNGAARTLNVKEAASTIAAAECQKLGWKKWQLNYIQEKDQGWMHVVVAKVDRKPYVEPTFPGASNNP